MGKSTLPRRARHASTTTREAPRLRDWHLVVSYLLFSALFFAPALSPTVTIFGTDYLAGGFFSHAFVSERLAEGALPKWYPYVFGGLPYFANPGSTFYPPMLLLRAILPTHALLAWIFFLQFFLAGVGTYYLLRELGTHRLAAYLGGVSYMFAGFLASSVYAGHDGRLITATLTPALLLTILRGVRTGRLIWFVLGGTILGMSLLSFQIQSNYYMLLAAAIVATYALAASWRGLESRGVAARVGGGLLILAIGFGLASVNFLPFLSYVEHSPRGGAEGRGYEYAVSWSMPPREIAGVAYPDYVGISVGESNTYWGDNPFKLHTEYVGAWAVALFLLGLVLLWRDRRLWLWGGVGGLALLISLGGYTPVYQLFYEVLPGTKRFRAPSISFFLVVLSINVIAALAFSRLLDLIDVGQQRRGEASEERTRVLYALAALCSIALVIALWATAGAPAGPRDIPAAVAMDPARAGRYLANYPAFVSDTWRFFLFLGAVSGLVWALLTDRLRPLAAGAALTVLILVDLWIVDRRFVETVPPPSVYFAPDDVVQALRSAPERVFRTWYVPGTPQTNYPTLYGIQLVTGEHGNQLQTYNEYLGAGEQQYFDLRNIIEHPEVFLSAANVRYLVSPQPLEVPFLTLVHQGSALVYRNESALPRAYLAAHFELAPPPDGALTLMRSEGFDPARTVVLYEPPPALVSGDTPLSGGAEIVRYESDRVEIRTQASRPALLVLADNFYADWRAEVNGQEMPVLRANHTFRAVPVPAGASTVEFVFRPQPLYIGFVVYLTLLALLAGYGLLLLWRGPRREDEPAR